ncbi:MAG: bifunctional riboflavin kinase/FMN adenylyltransferase [Clostridiales bacterium]|nr:MAG: bifunctional riboflavin kinase/FMN adenylyltransferase [Clostridiales bacterium]
MKVYYDLSKVNEISKEMVLAIGAFDGVHKGHRYLLYEAKKIAEKNNQVFAVFTFSNVPKFVGNTNEGLIFSEKFRNKIFESLGVEILINIDFTDEIKNIDRVDFINMLCDKLNLKTIVIGKDFKFGKHASGDVEFLKANSNKFCFDVKVVDFYMLNGEKISSRTIREFLNQGKVDDAYKLLGEYYCVNGIVIKGDMVGRTLGFKTANLAINKQQRIIKSGVYMSKVFYNNVYYNSITNVGFRPTVCGEKLLVETHILDFDKNIYDEEIFVMFLCKIRDEKKFDSLTELSNQIRYDISFVKEKIISLSI